MRLRIWNLLLLLIALAGVAAGVTAWQRQQREAALPDGIVRTNGRIEAEQIDVATKLAGRVVEVTVGEGDFVAAGAVIARLDPAGAEAQLRAAEAQARAAVQARLEAEAAVARARAEHDYALAEYNRAAELARRGFAPLERVDQRRSQLQTTEAAGAAAGAGLRRAEASVEAAEAVAAQARSALDDLVLTAPRAGRVLYRLAQPGEVLPAGGRVVTLIDPLDVSMIVFLPARVAGRLAYGAEARLVLDPIPQYIIPAAVSFVSPDAQFTPRQVETAEERESLMFRVKLRLPEPLLRAHAEQVKGGVRGVAYVRERPDAAWPDRLAVRLP